MANETRECVQAKSKQAMKQVFRIKNKNETAHMKVTPPRWQPLRRRTTCAMKPERRRHCFQPFILEKLIMKGHCAPDHYDKRARYM